MRDSWASSLSSAAYLALTLGDGLSDPTRSLSSEISCWSEEYNFHFCCQFPPKHSHFRDGCFDALPPQPGFFTYERCCDYEHGPSLHVLPTMLWEGPVRLRFNLFSDGAARKDALEVYVHQVQFHQVQEGHEKELVCILWDDSIARFMLAQGEFSRWMPSPTRGKSFLDIGSGVGFAGARSNVVFLDVGGGVGLNLRFF